MARVLGFLEALFAPTRKQVNMPEGCFHATGTILLSKRDTSLRTS